MGGINVCGQTHGERKVYSLGQRPLDLMLTGNYTPVPIFYGANKFEGTLALSGNRYNRTSMLPLSIYIVMGCDNNT